LSNFPQISIIERLLDLGCPKGVAISGKFPLAEFPLSEAIYITPYGEADAECGTKYTKRMKLTDVEKIKVNVIYYGTKTKDIAAQGKSNHKHKKWDTLLFGICILI